jgi:hypothetical protein
MKKIMVGILLGFCILLGLTVFIQRKKIWNLDEYDCCGDEECCCDDESGECCNDEECECKENKKEGKEGVEHPTVDPAV